MTKQPSDSDISNAKQEAGFIAQEVALIPELAPYVNVGNETELWSVNYTCLFTYALAATKELDSIVQI